MRCNEEGYLEPRFPEFAEARSQDLEECFHDAGQFYWGRPEGFLESVPLYSGHSVPVFLPRHLVQDIDTEEDWVRAEIMHTVLEQRKTEGEHNVDL